MIAAAAASLIAWSVGGGIDVGAASVLAPAYTAGFSPAWMHKCLGSTPQPAVVRGVFIGLPSDARPAVAAASQWPANFAISSTFPVMAQFSVPFLYSAFTAILLLFVLKAVREIRGVELEGMPGQVPAGAPQWPPLANGIRIWLAS